MKLSPHVKDLLPGTQLQNRDTAAADMAVHGSNTVSHFRLIFASINFL